MSNCNSNFPPAGGSATVTTIDHHKRQAVALWWDSLDENNDRWFHDFIKAHRLAIHHNPTATAELMRNFQPVSMNQAIQTYHGLLKISADAIHSHLIKPAANGD